LLLTRAVGTKQRLADYTGGTRDLALPYSDFAPDGQTCQSGGHTALNVERGGERFSGFKE
jgi:hypothetical protein